MKNYHPHFLSKPLITIGLAFTIGFSLHSVLAGDDLITNPGFEATESAPWEWYTSHGADAQGTLDSTLGHGGKASFKITKAGETEPDVYGALRQTIKVEPDTTYRVSVWVKGENVGMSSLMIGKDWTTRVTVPQGSYDWVQFSKEYTTKSEETEIPVVIVVEGQTDGLWIDDVQVIKADQKSSAVRVYEPVVTSGVPTQAKFYPLFLDTPFGHRPAVHFVSKTNPPFAAEIRLGGNAGIFFLTVM